MKKEFWITNISKMNVTLGDLRLSIRKGGSLNLLDSKHFNYTSEQIEKSLASGSLFLKRDKIIVRKLAPEMVPLPPKELSNKPLPLRKTSAVTFEEIEYEELKHNDSITDEQFAAEFVESLEWNPKKKK